VVEVSSQPVAADEAVLLVDSNTGAAALGVRSTLAADRCLLFEANDLHLELRIAARMPQSPTTWVYGLVLGEGSVRPRTRASVALVQGSEEQRVELGETGEFALPCDASQPIVLELSWTDRKPVRVTVPA
jgi:hypothetical protein